ncbi:MAG: aldo/keto reductase [Candidatus Solincola sediminis]|uniref:Aldo/keto reductase n=1 Tax=Candidatus Solincola sediminis TaxID=1797199 RepID=A0A1F2WKX8_9ACTN|nr:MAG: aldo/keto reductase [Candidatus Solincola sediminis]
MLYRKIEKTGDNLSILGFGCMRLAGGQAAIDEDRATRQIRFAIDRGVNYIDTAFPYHLGTSEPFLGRALTDGYREKIKLATKLPPWITNSRQDMDNILAQQLERLRTGAIDYYLLHALDAGIWAKLEGLGVLDFLDKAKAAGFIVNSGFSFHGELETFKEIIDSYDWDVCQIQYNFLDDKVQAGTEGLEYAASAGLGIIIMEPLRGGGLTARIPAEVQAIWDKAEVRRSPAEWALRWVWNRPEVSVVLSGMNEESQVEENLRIADEGYPGSLTEKELELVGRVEKTYRSLMKVGCTGCRYCMPCPQGVDIPSCFDVYNIKHVFAAQDAQLIYTVRNGALAGEPSYASLCTECGTCEDLCPQGLDIPALLKDVAAEFDKGLI